MWQRISLLGIVPLLLASLAVPADGSGCNQAQVTYSVQQVQAYAQPVQQTYQTYQALATYYVPLAVQQYSIGYTPETETGSLTEELLRVKLELKELQLQQIKLQLQAPPQQFQQQQYQQPYPQQQQQHYQQQQVLPQKTSALGVLHDRCNSCHESKRAEASGGGFVLFRGGSPVELTADGKLGVLRQITLGKMPKGGSLSNEELTIVLEGL